MLRTRTAALAAALMIGVSTIAVAQEQPRAEREGPRQGRMKAGKARMQQRLFRGITLSDAQKSRLETIRTSYRTRFEALHEQMRPRMQALRDARQKNDTAAVRSARSAMEQHREQMRALSEQQRAEVRGVLTSEQQLTFDKNVTEARDRMAKRAEHRHEHGRRGGGRRGQDRGPEGQRPGA